MSRITVTNTDFETYNSSLAVTKTAIDFDSGIAVNIDGLSDERTQVYVEVTAGSMDIKVNEGVYEEAVYGSMLIESAVAGLQALALSSSRFKDSDNEIKIDFTDNGSGAGNVFVTNYALSK